VFLHGYWGFFGYWRHKYPKKKQGDKRVEEMLRKLYENLLRSRLMANYSGFIIADSWHVCSGMAIENLFQKIHENKSNYSGISGIGRSIDNLLYHQKKKQKTSTACTENASSHRCIFESKILCKIKGAAWLLLYIVFIRSIS
jgi:hypothetical protein